MKSLRLRFHLEGAEATLTLGPFTPYWAAIWLAELHQHGLRVGKETLHFERAAIVDYEEWP